jgi:hypothetical protein
MAPTRFMRAFLVASGVFALLAGTLLALGAERTDERFAWTIASDLTTGFLNGMYWSATLLLLLAARESSWAAARYGAYSAVVFTSLLFVVMLAHFDQLHTDDSRFLVSAGAWGFLASYAVLPAVGIAALVVQARSGHERSPQVDPIRSWLRLVLAIQAGAAAVVGSALLVGGADAGGLWPWPLTPIGARAIGAWLVALAVISGLAARGADWRNLATVPPTYALQFVLQTSVLVRFGGGVDWNDPAAWLYLAALGTFLAVALAAVPRWLDRGRERESERQFAERI